MAQPGIEAIIEQQRAEMAAAGVNTSPAAPAAEGEEVSTPESTE
jgi:hypothetical protein